MEKFTYMLTIIDKDNPDDMHCQFKLPFLPRVGDNIIVGEESFQVLVCNIHADQIMEYKADQPKIQLASGNQKVSDDTEVVIPVVLVVALRVLDLSEESDE